MASRGNHRVGVNADKNFFAAQVFQSEIESVRLAGVGLGQDEDPAAGLFEGKCSPRDFERLVAGAVVNHDDAQVGIVRG